MLQNIENKYNQSLNAQQKRQPLKPLQIKVEDIQYQTPTKQLLNTQLKQKVFKSVSSTEDQPRLKGPYLMPQNYRINITKPDEQMDMLRDQKQGAWNPIEDQKLKEGIAMYGQCRWRLISDYVGQRSPIQCLHRWTKILKPGLVKGPWTPQEDEKLQAWIKTKGPEKWAECSQFITGRSGKQCRERWLNTLNPKLKKGSWTQCEDELIFKLYQKLGSSWSKIAQHIPGRTENSIKNRFYSTLRKIVRMKKIMDNKNDDIPEEEKNKLFKQEQKSCLFRILIEYPDLELLIKSKSVKYRSYKRSKSKKREQKLLAKKLEYDLQVAQKQAVTNASIEELNQVLGKDGDFCSLVGRQKGPFQFQNPQIKLQNITYPTNQSTISMSNAQTQTFKKPMETQTVINMFQQTSTQQQIQPNPIQKTHIQPTQSIQIQTQTAPTNAMINNYQNVIPQIPQIPQIPTPPLLKQQQDKSFFTLIKNKMDKTQNNQILTNQQKIDNLPEISKLNKFVFLMRQLQTLEGMLNFTKTELANLNFLQEANANQHTNQPTVVPKLRKKRSETTQVRNIIIQNSGDSEKMKKSNQVGFKRTLSGNSHTGFKRKSSKLSNPTRLTLKQIKRQDTGFLSDTAKGEDNPDSE